MSTSIRTAILLALVDRIAAAQTEWSVQLRGLLNENPDDAPVLCVVAFDGENKVLANTDTYNATMGVEVLVIARAEDADNVEDDGNPYRYLDRLVVAIERVVHAPDAWGIAPDFTDVVVDGHQVSDPTDEQEVSALVHLTFRYRHSYQDPEA